MTLYHRPCHDPLVIAGHVQCQACGRVAYPTDATWLTPRTIVAFYPAACRHHRPRAWLLDLDTPATPDAFCGAPTRAGTACRNRSRDGRPCRHHEGRWQ